MFTVCCYIFIKIMVSGLNLICLVCLKSNNISHRKKNQYLFIYLFTVSHKSEYTPHISAINLVYLFKGQYYRNESWIYFRVVNVQLV